jgi:hypothetical protein
MLFTCDVLIIVLGVTSSNLVIFFICFPCVHLANATVLITTATMLNCKFNSVLRIKEKAPIKLSVFILLESLKELLSFKKGTGM